MHRGFVDFAVADAVAVLVRIAWGPFEEGPGASYPFDCMAQAAAAAVVEKGMAVVHLEYSCSVSTCWYCT